MKRMSRVASKKSHSWWWDSHINPKNSKWLADNLEEMDRCVKEMLKLIEEEGDSFAKKAEMYYQKRPELVAHVEDFYRMYRALAEGYDNVTGELRRNMTLELRSQGSGSGSDLGSEPPSLSLLHPPELKELTPELKLPRPKTGPRAAGFEVFLGSGGSYDLSQKGSDGLSSSSSSDSDSDGSKDANVDDMSSILQHRILELENELRSAMDKLHEEKGTNSHHEHFENGDHGDCNSRISALEKELVFTAENLSVAEAEIMRLREKLAENTVLSETVGYGIHAECNSRISALEKELAVTGENLSNAEAKLLSLGQNLAEKTVISETEDMDPRLEKKNLAELEELVGVLEAEISHGKQEIDDLKGVMTAANQQFETDILLRDRAIDECKTEIASLSEVYLQEKVLLEAEVTNRAWSVFSSFDQRVEKAINITEDTCPDSVQDVDGAHSSRTPRPTPLTAQQPLLSHSVSRTNAQSDSSQNARSSGSKRSRQDEDDNIVCRLTGFINRLADSINSGAATLASSLEHWTEKVGKVVMDMSGYEFDDLGCVLGDLISDENRARMFLASPDPLRRMMIDDILRR